MLDRVHDFQHMRGEYRAGLDLAIEGGWLVLHESGTFVRFTQGGVELFA